MKTITTFLYFVNLIYAFIYWGSGHGVANLFIPYAMIADFVMKMGRI